MGTSSVHILKIFKPGPSEKWGGGWGLQPNNLLKFDDFCKVEKAVIAKVVGMKI